MSKRKGDYIYSDRDMLSAFRRGDTQMSYYERTKICVQTIHRRFGSWNSFKALAEKGMA